MYISKELEKTELTMARVTQEHIVNKAYPRHVKGLPSPYTGTYKRHFCQLGCMKSCIDPFNLSKTL